MITLLASKTFVALFYALCVYLLFGELFDDLIQGLRKKWRNHRFGETDLESRNAGFQLNTSLSEYLRSRPFKVRPGPGSKPDPIPVGKSRLEG